MLVVVVVLVIVMMLVLCGAGRGVGCSACSGVVVVVQELVFESGAQTAVVP